MRIKESKINPLKDILNSIPNEGLKLTEQNLTRLALFFNSGGVVFESFDEILRGIQILAEEVPGLKIIDGTLHKVKHGS